MKSGNLNFLEPKITKWQKYSQNTTIFLSYERVDHIAVYNYMFRPLSAIVRLYYFLLQSKAIQYIRGPIHK